MLATLPESPNRQPLRAFAQRTKSELERLEPMGLFKVDVFPSNASTLPESTTVVWVPPDLASLNVTSRSEQACHQMLGTHRPSHIGYYISFTCYSSRICNYGCPITSPSLECFQQKLPMKAPNPSASSNSTLSLTYCSTPLKSANPWFPPNLPLYNRSNRSLKLIQLIHPQPCT